MNNEFCCLDCAMSAMSSPMPVAQEREGATAIPRMVRGVCPECGSEETVDLSEAK
jgi:hypothetical protein